MILAIDPGNIESAFALLDKTTLKIIRFGKVANEDLLDDLNMDRFFLDESIELGKSIEPIYPEHFAIEMVACYGMPVGKEIFDTVFWIGRFWENANFKEENKKFIYRKEETMNLCGSMRAKDGNIIQALKDRFGERGTKKNPGWFYGVKKDCWQAVAVGVTYHDMYLNSEVRGGFSDVPMPNL